MHSCCATYAELIIVICVITDARLLVFMVILWSGDVKFISKVIILGIMCCTLFVFCAKSRIVMNELK